MKKLGLLMIGLLLINNLVLFSQDKSKKLFEYPVVPDTISTLENRTNYLVTHFWEKANFTKPIKDTLALQEAFNDYVVFFQYAHKNIVLTSINNLMNKVQANKANFMLMAEVAEKGLYDVGAVMWSDEAYLPFVEAVINNKKVKSDEKARYIAQAKKINDNKIGEIIQMFDYVDTDGKKNSFKDVAGETILVFFNDRNCDDCTISRLRLSTNVTINNLIDEGKLKIVSIYPGEYSKKWAEEAKKDSERWTIGAYTDAHKTFDIRILPNIYILDKDKRIILKNVGVNDIIQQLER